MDISDWIVAIFAGISWIMFLKVFYDVMEIKEKLDSIEEEINRMSRRIP